jgi:hypothetical protein
VAGTLPLSNSYAVGATLAPSKPRPRWPAASTARFTMLDIVLVGSGLLFFALALGYAALCELL